MGGWHNKRQLYLLCCSVVFQAETQQTSDNACTTTITIAINCEITQTETCIRAVTTHYLHVCSCYHITANSETTKELHVFRLSCHAHISQTGQKSNAAVGFNCHLNGMGTEKTSMDLSICNPCFTTVLGLLPSAPSDHVWSVVSC